MIFYAIQALTKFISASYTLSSTFYLHLYVNAMFLISIIWKLSVDLRPQELG